MKNQKSNNSVKVMRYKLCSILLICSLISVFSCTTMQYGFDAQENSVFSSFDNLGMTKKDFIEQYGLPTNKAMSEETSGTVERLYYAERIKDFLVTTEFIFLNDTLRIMERDDVIKLYRNTETQTIAQ